MMLATNRNR